MRYIPGFEKLYYNFFVAGIPEIIGEALWMLNNNFELYWGKACAEVLRAVHQAVYRLADDERKM